MTVAFRKLHPFFAGEVAGIDLTQPLDDQMRDAIVAGLNEYAVLVFHGPCLTEDDQVAFADRFGKLEPQNGVLTTGVKQRVSPKLVDISNLDENNGLLDRNDRRRMFSLGNRLWHTDSSFKKTPAKYSMLHAHTVVPEGGETQFVDTRAAWDALPQRMKQQVDALIVEHSIFTSRAKLGFTKFSEQERLATPPVLRRLVREHPGSGRKALYLASHASHIVDWPVPEGRMLLQDLMEHATQPQFVHTHRWQVGDLVIWDNRCTMHRACAYDADAYRRDMRRATIQDLDPAQQDLRVA
jgi:alpha-ketoglutarate-dependent 2,4-dichlorophenoxyacetate dioxygenase